ncbi:MAG: anion transporter [Methanobacteriales archaeon HGW-Methanobacteriales-1]|nr:MAG: anion transporter [Methanobacteriales archaeon HGW-Methanobacteriales-1]
MLVPMQGLSYPGHAAIALLVFAVILWASEAYHLAVTSIVILFLQPIIGVATFDKAILGFASPIIFLMIGGFIIAEAIRKSGLAQRMTFWMLGKVGTSPDRGLFVSVFATGLLSAWIENVVAFAMLLPIIKEVIPMMGAEDPEKGKSNFAKAMVLGASYGSLAGGFSTPIGTAPNLMAYAYLHIPFANWMAFGFPLAIAMLFVIWKLLGKIFPFEVKGISGGKDLVKSKLDDLGPISRNEKLSGIILLLTIGLWLTTGYTGLSSYAIALMGAFLFFAFNIIEWEDAQKNVDWGLIVFFGGALSLGAALLNTGAANWMIQNILAMLGSHPSTILIMILLMVVATLITQVMSNIALSAILIPLSVTLASAQGLALGTYAVPVAIACSLSFMFPMADPTVAMAYGTKYVNIKEILKAGIPLVVIGIILTILVMIFWAPRFL